MPNSEREASSSAAVQPALADCMCPICMEILIEPVTMPCKHELCMPCFQQNVQESLTCPICRSRISSWARNAARKHTLINQTRWRIIRKHFAKEVADRMSGRADYESVTVPPVHEVAHILAAPGEIRREYEEEIKKFNEQLRLEREQEEAASRSLIEKLQTFEATKVQMEEHDEFIAHHLEVQTLHLPSASNFSYLLALLCTFLLQTVEPTEDTCAIIDRLRKSLNEKTNIFSLYDRMVAEVAQPTNTDRNSDEHESEENTIEQAASSSSASLIVSMPHLSDSANAEAEADLMTRMPDPTSTSVSSQASRQSVVSVATQTASQAFPVSAAAAVASSSSNVESTAPDVSSQRIIRSTTARSQSTASCHCAMCTLMVNVPPSSSAAATDAEAAEEETAGNNENNDDGEDNDEANCNSIAQRTRSRRPGSIADVESEQQTIIDLSDLLPSNRSRRQNRRRPAVPTPPSNSSTRSSVSTRKSSRRTDSSDPYSASTSVNYYPSSNSTSSSTSRTSTEKFTRSSSRTMSSPSTAVTSRSSVSVSSRSSRRIQY